MRKLTLSLFVGLLSANALFAQTKPAITVEKWAEKPVIHTIDAKHSKESVIVLADTRRVEYVDGANDELEAYYTLHRLVHVNDDAGIERFNKVYLNINENFEIIDVKARTILPNGKVFELNKDNIKQIKEDDDRTYRIFAMEGLEKGCEVEYYYTFKRPASYFGHEPMQSDLPQMANTFELICPARLHFEIKPYNFKTVVSDTVLNGRRVMACSQKETPGVEEEKYADYAANINRIEYKLSYNDEVRKGERLFSWNELARRVYPAYSASTPKDNAIIQGMIKENGWDKLSDDSKKISAAEHFIKKKFSYDEDMSDAAANELIAVFKNKNAGLIGTLRLYSAIFSNLGIPYQYVMAGDRTSMVIDRDFENWNNCDNVLFYFPASNKYLAPTRPECRYPWIAPEWGAANGVYLRKTTLGNMTTALADIKTIEIEPYDKSASNIDSRLEMNKSLDSLVVDFKHSFSGYSASFPRYAVNYANEDGRKSLMKEMAKMGSGSEHIIFSEVLNPEFEKATDNQPLVIHIKTSSPEFIEKAGDKLLVKIGQAIGTQVEMYQEKKRVFPVNIDYGHMQKRKLELVIPEGYVVKNLNDLKISKIVKDKDEVTMGFDSDYKLTGNLLTVNILEEYRNIYYPLSQFEEFRKVINSSSDFNKVVLVLEKI